VLFQAAFKPAQVSPEDLQTVDSDRRQTLEGKIWLRA